MARIGCRFRCLLSYPAPVLGGVQTRRPASIIVSSLLALHCSLTLLAWPVQPPHPVIRTLKEAATLVTSSAMLQWPLPDCPNGVPNKLLKRSFFWGGETTA